MPFIPVPNGAEVEVRCMLDNSKVENTLWFSDGTGWNASKLLTLATDVGSWFEFELLPHLAAGVSLVEVFAKDHSTAAGAEATFVPTLPISGSGGPQATSSITLAVSFRTALGGRSFRGRNYVIGIPTGALNDADHVSSTFANQMTTAYNKLHQGTVITNGVWSVASRFSGVNSGTGKPIPRASGLLTPIIAAVVTDFIVDNQRRRLPGRGR